MKLGWCLALSLVAVHSHAGEIPGMPTKLPPFLDSRFEFAFSNDFLGRGGDVDDFRTQQFMFTSRFADRWLAVADHSVLTLKEPGREGRIDQVALSLGYRLIDSQTTDASLRVAAGLGIRGVGDYGGENMQNGFHRLIDDGVNFLPYSNVDETYATAWIDTERYATFRQAAGHWRFGYWLRGRALATSDGQFDATVSASAVASRGGIDIWAGLRQDWRTGYTETVQRETARAEQDTAGVLGVRFGSMIIETVQQFEQGGSFGQLRFVSSEAAADSSAAVPARFALETGFLLPDVHVFLQGRLGSGLLARRDSVWSGSFLFSFDFGEPQYGSDNTVYIDSRQAAIGLEWERPVSRSSRWLAGYASASLGWREEKLIGDGPLLGEESAAADSGVFVLGAGFRFHASALGGHWRYRIRIGLSTWLPFDESRRSVGGKDLAVLEPSTGLSVGLSFEFT